MLEPVVSLTSLSLDLTRGPMVYFLSDVHLGFGKPEADRERERLLLRLLDRLSRDAAHVFIVCDLFDYWFDYKTVVPRRHVRTLAALHNLRDAGVPMTYLMGNHDFGHYTYFEEELGLQVITGDVSVRLGEKLFYISHGDGKAHNDMGYLMLRTVLRNPFAQWVYRVLHPDLGIGLASGTSEGSREYTDRKDFGTTDGIRDFAAERIAEGFDVVVMGHRHIAAEEQIGRGLYVNLGHWLGTEPTFAAFTTATADMSLLTVHGYLGE
ncbi:UDP-2,3-diacylglucosamine diphosphatase [soil metagenome]